MRFKHLLLSDSDTDADEVSFEDLLELAGSVEIDVLNADIWFQLVDALDYENNSVAQLVHHLTTVHMQLSLLTDNFKNTDIEENDQLKLFLANVLRSSGKYNMTLYINTYGGAAYVLAHILYGIAQLRADFSKIKIPFELTTVNMFYAASAGAFLFSIGDKRVATPSSAFLFHRVQYASSHDGALMQYLKYLEKMHEFFVWLEDIPVPYLKKDTKIYKAYLNDEDVFIDVKTAKKIKLVTDIVDVSKYIRPTKTKKRRRKNV